MLGVQRGGNWSIHFGVETTKQAFQGNPELPGILDQENAHSAQIRWFTGALAATIHHGHRKSQRNEGCRPRTKLSHCIFELATRAFREGGRLRSATTGNHEILAPILA